MGKKKGLFQALIDFLSDRSPFMTWVGRTALLAVLNLCWLLCSLPVLTGGAALIALYTVLMERADCTYDAALKRFVYIFRSRWKDSFPLWLWTLAVCGGLAVSWQIVLSQGLTNRFLFMAPLLLASIVVLFTLLWLYPLLAAGIPPKKAIQTAFVLGLREVWRSLLLLILAASAVVFALWCFIASMTLAGIWFLLGFTPIACIMLKLIEGVLPEALHK